MLLKSYDQNTKKKRRNFRIFMVVKFKILILLILIQKFYIFNNIFKKNTFY